MAARMVGGMGGVPMGRAFGIPIRFHWSWLLLFGLVSWSLAGYFGLALRGAGTLGRRVALAPVIPGLGPAEGLLVLGVVTAALFGVSLLAHELAHSLVARRNGIRVRGITLFFFGGVAEIASLPRTPGAEFRVAVVGPLTSLALAALFWVVSTQLGQLGLSRTLTLPAGWLAQTNLMLALFNLLPGFPLDGGRVFRSIIWRISGNARTSTRIAARVGRLVGFGFVGWGLLGMTGLFGFGGGGAGGFGSGLWQIFVGLFLQNAARSQAQESELEHAFDGLTVGHALGPEPAPPGRPLMVPVDTDLMEALRLMEEHGVGQVLVMADGPAGGREVGVLTREKALGYLRLRRELDRQHGHA